MNAAEIARALGQDDVEARRRAVLALPAVRDPQVGALLLRALGDRDWRVRAEAVKVGQLVAERAGVVSDVVEAARQHDDVGLRSAALELLLAGNESLLAPLLAALPSWDARSRRVASEALARTGKRVVIEALAGPAVDLGSATIDALSELPGAEADVELRRRLRSADAFERVAAIDALNRRGAVVPYAELQPLLQDRMASRGALRALGRSGEVAVLGPLLDSLVDPRELFAITALIALAEAVTTPALRVELERRLKEGGASAKGRMRQLPAQGGEGVGVSALSLLALAQDRAAPALALSLVERGVAPAQVAAALAAYGTDVWRELDAAVRQLSPGARDTADALAGELRALVPAPAQPSPSAVARPTGLLSTLGGRTRGAPTIFDLPRLSAEDFRSFQALVRASAGIMLQEDARASLERRLGERVMALDLGSFSEYLHYLRSHAAGAAEIERMIDVVTVHETYFFREAPQLMAFASEVLPLLRAQIGARRALTLWSAGCSTGEEAYSLAMLVADSGLFEDCTVRVIGNDISRRVIQVARRGVYRGASFRALPPHHERYFVDAEGGRQVREDIRAMCHFTRLNLLDGTRAAVVGRADAVFCRNLLIYFDDAARAELVQTFYERLLPGGFLMLGHSESLLNVSTDFELHQLSADLVYRKPSGGAGRS